MTRVLAFLFVTLSLLPSFALANRGQRDAREVDGFNRIDSTREIQSDETGTSKDPKLVVEHAAPNSAPSAPTSLLTEGQSNPANISDSTPEFSAIYNDADSSDNALYYKLQIATSSAFTSTYWDSGKTSMATTSQGSRSPDISYGGTALASSTTYYWRVKFWDAADAEGAWSTSEASFSLAASAGGAGGTNIQDISFGYDNVGNITSITDNSDSGAGKSLTFFYDTLYRLTYASTTAASSTPFKQTYAFDLLGSILGWRSDSSATSTYAYAGTGYLNPHAKSSIGDGMATTTYTYDNNGNITSASPWTYAWDYRNRLTSAGSGAATTTYGYDHTEQRASKVTGASSTIYPNKYHEVSGATTTSYVFLPGGDLVATIEGTGTATSTYYIHPDHLGSTNVTTNASGTAVQVLDYYPYGSVRINSGSNATDHQYIGERYDSSSDLNYFHARYYSSGRGQFVSQDPTFLGDPREQNLTNPQSLNSYSYANGNPIVNKDPNGEQAQAAALAGIAAGLTRILASLAALSASGVAFASPQAQQSLMQISQQLNQLSKSIITTTIGITTTFMPLGGTQALPQDSVIGGTSVTTPYMITKPGQPNIVLSDATKGTPKPSDAPSGTKPIDQTGLSKDQVHQIKKTIEAGPKDWVGKAPNGDIITGTPKGKTINHGPIQPYGR